MDEPVSNRSGALHLHARFLGDLCVLGSVLCIAPHAYSYRYSVFCQRRSHFILHWVGLEKQTVLCVVLLQEYTCFPYLILHTPNSFPFSMHVHQLYTHWNSKLVLEGIFKQPVLIELCFKFLNILPVPSESLCGIRIYLQWKQLFYLFGRLTSPTTW